MKIPEWMRDVEAMTQAIREHRKTCPTGICSPTFKDDAGKPVIVDCIPVSELPGYRASCCCREPDCSYNP